MRRKVLVNGCPKSGTTWMLRFVTNIPGYRDVGNFRGDIERYRTIEPGNVVHGHDPHTAHLWELLQGEGVRVVLLTRDPRDQAVSRFHHARRDESHPYHAEISSLSHEEGLMASIEGGARIRGVVGSIRFSEKWTLLGNEICVVRYEDLWADPTSELRRTLDFLGILTTEWLVRAIVERNRFERLSIGRQIWKRGRSPGSEDVNSHFRKGIVGDWKSYFGEAHISRFKELAGEELINLGYEKDWNW